LWAGHIIFFFMVFQTTVQTCYHQFAGPGSTHCIDE